MEYLAPRSFSEALDFLGKWKNRAKLVAGGTNVIPYMRSKTLKPEVLIDISRLKNLSYIKEEKQRIRIGGLTTISKLTASTVIQDYAPILSDAANHLGNPLVRNRATIAGNLADASPAADTPVPLLALEGAVVLNRLGGDSRRIPLDQFFLGPNQTVLRTDEIIREITFPKPEPSAKMAYINLALRNAMAITLVSVAILIEMKGEKCKKVRIGFGTVAPKPMRAYGAEGVLTDKEITEEQIEKCCQEAEKEVQPNPRPSIRASAGYRRSMASALLRQAIHQALLGEEK